MSKRFLCKAAVAVAVAVTTVPVSAADPPLDKLTLPTGFTIAVYAADVPNARQMALSPNGTLFVGSRQAGNVYAVLDDNQDQVADRVVTIASGLRQPNGVAFHNGDLYVSAISQILRFDDIESTLDNPPPATVVTSTIPSERAHGWKFIAFGPEGSLYVPVGAPCNICDRTDEDDRFATILRMNADGSSEEIFAHGIRNSVGFDWHPGTGELWFSSNGRDRLGDENPPDTLNHAPQPGLHFGYPFCHAGDIQDPEFSQRPCSEFRAPAQKLGPHVASLGLRFYTGSMFPAAYRNQIFIAEHGSWNRAPDAGHTGYRLTVARLDGNRVSSYEVFAEGWLETTNEAWGRPVDVLVMPDGALLVSDDRVGAIYRISYSE